MSKDDYDLAKLWMKSTGINYHLPNQEGYSTASPKDLVSLGGVDNP